MKRSLFISIMACLALVFVIGAGWLLQSPPPVIDAARSAERLQAWTDLQVQNQKRLSAYARAAESGRFQIPIERAMELTVQELNHRATLSSTPPPVP